MNSKPMDRRDFLKTSAGAAALSIGLAGCASTRKPAMTARAAQRRIGANDRIQVGVIGAGGGQAKWHLKTLLEQPDVDLAAICDVWQERLDNAMELCKGSPKPCHDYREVLQRDDIDAVLIATPPHWHALQAIHACEAGKDFYLEKPMTLSVTESLAVLRAVRKYDTITQIGTQIHAGAHYRRVVDIIRSGNLGKVNVVRTYHVLNQGPEGIGNPPVGDPPKGLDWDFWCGPSPLRAYHPLLAKGSYHHPSFMYSGGWTPGMAPHIIDLPYWALELGHPTCVSSSGGRYTIRDAGDAYDIQEVLWQYPGLTMTWFTNMVNSYGFDFHGEPARKRRLGIYFHAVNGTLITNYSTHKIVAEGDFMKDAPEPPKVIPDSPGHHREWLDCIRTRKQPSCHVGYHYKLDVAINLAMLALKLGRSVHFDPKTETIVNDRQAAKLLRIDYRDPWKMPKEYL